MVSKKDSSTNSVFNSLNFIGFKIVSEGMYNEINEDCSASQPAYETIYALLQSISPLYIKSFGNSLINSLNKLSQK